MRWTYIAPILVLAFALSACEGFVGLPHAYLGDAEIKSPIGLDIEIEGVPSIVPEDWEPMGYRNGAVEDAYSYIKTSETTATGMAAIVTACEAKADCIEAVLDQEAVLDREAELLGMLP